LTQNKKIDKSQVGIAKTILKYIKKIARLFIKKGRKEYKTVKVEVSKDFQGEKEDFLTKKRIR
jgi:hypothetical protein